MKVNMTALAIGFITGGYAVQGLRILAYLSAILWLWGVI